MFAEQLVRNSSTQFHENPTDCLVPVGWTWSRNKTFFFLLRTEYLKLEAAAGMGVSYKKLVTVRQTARL